MVCLFAAYRTGRRGKLVENIPTSSTAGIFIGLVEVKGKVESANPLISHLAGCSCVDYQWSVQEHWSRTVTKTITDSKGRTRRRSHRQSGWKTVAQGGERMPFYLRDDEGTVLVRPREARIEPLRVFSETCGRSHPLYYDKGPATSVSHSDHRRRFTEHALPVNQSLYIMGQARERQDVVAPEIAHDPAAPLFLISVRNEPQIQSRHRAAFVAWTLGGMLLMMGGAALLARAGASPHLQGAGVLVLAGALYSGMASLAWLWMTYNSLIDLRQRLLRAWSHVEVQLKRRHDLIPNLLAAVSGLRDHEHELQAELARLRTQLAATAPGEIGSDYRGLHPCIHALAENYPLLKTDAGFMRLQQNLSNTEERIALARGYFNEIATHFNTRLETIPEKFVARIAHMKPRPLLAAGEFERAPVSVERHKAEPALP